MLVFADNSSTVLGVVIAVVAAMVTFILVRVCASLLRSGALNMALKRMPTLNNRMLKMEIFVQNDSAKEIRFHGLSIAYGDGSKKMTVLAPLFAMPIQRTGNAGFVYREGDGFAFRVKPNAKYSAVVEFRLAGTQSIPHDAMVYLLSKNAKGKPIRAEAALRVGVMENIRFKRY